MDITVILGLINKGLIVVENLVEAEQSAEPAIKALIALVTGAQNGTVTDADLEKTEALLDSLIEDFNAA